MNDRGRGVGFGTRPGLASVVTAALVMGLAPAFGQDQPAGIPGVPSPNGYDDLLAAAYQVRKTLDPSVDLAGPAGKGVREVLEANRDALVTAREALGRDCFVPLRYDPVQIQLAIDRSSALRTLARLFLAEEKLAEADERRPDAIRSATDLIRLGQATGRGGLLIESLVGAAIETYGIDALARIMPRMSEAELSKAIDMLAEVERTAEPFLVIAGREMTFAREAHGLRMKAAFLVTPQLKTMLQDSIDAAESGFLRTQARRRLLMVELAIRLYQSREGAEPTSLADLAPAVLRDVPVDPYSGEAFLYRPGPSGHLLYSVGSDRDDDGGRPYNSKDREPDGDVFLGPAK